MLHYSLNPFVLLLKVHVYVGFISFKVTCFKYNVHSTFGLHDVFELIF
jgi:hypothetical protein